MIKNTSKNAQKNLVIDLNSPDGNAFVILGHAKNLSKKLNLNWTEINAEMTSGNYDNLIMVFKKYFGNFVIIK